MVQSMDVRMMATVVVTRQILFSICVSRSHFEAVTLNRSMAQQQEKDQGRRLCTGKQLLVEINRPAVKF